MNSRMRDVNMLYTDDLDYISFHFQHQFFTIIVTSSLSNPTFSHNTLNSSAHLPAQWGLGPTVSCFHIIFSDVPESFVLPLSDLVISRLLGSLPAVGLLSDCWTLPSHRKNVSSTYYEFLLSDLTGDLTAALQF